MEYDHEPRSPSFRSSPSSWIKSKAVDLPEEIKDKFAGFFSKIVASGARSSRRPINTSEFRYDPASYALNFEDESARIDDHEFPSQWSFPTTARSQESFPANVSRQMAACN